MATLKEADTLVGSSAPADGAAKTSADTATRTQPVALEIPVTINGAHTVAGSDKREPFSETTQTVLVFAVGAVVRVNTSLAPGQLVFLTNEKTKKEVVCQVLKSKPGGSGSGGYVELQFTEPAPGFWGLRMAGSPASVPAPAVPAPKPTASVPAPAKPAAAPPQPAPALSESVLAKPKAPTSAPVLPSAPPKTANTSSAASLKITSTPAPTPPQAPLVSVPPPSPLASSKEPAAPVHAVPVVPPPADSSSTASDDKRPGTPILHDYSKDIDALFTTSSAHASAPPAVAPPDPSVPSTEQLKADAARLQAQLGSLLFNETPATGSATPAAPTPKSEPSNLLAQKVFDIAKDEPKPAVSSEPSIPAPSALKPGAPAVSAEEQEVKVPAWLAPLSQPSEPALEAAHSISVESADETSASFGESSTDSSASRSQAAVFGGQLLGESSEARVASSGSKKGLWIGIAAAAVLSVAGAAWYLRADLLGSSKSSPANKPASAVVSSLPSSQPIADSKPSAFAPDTKPNSAPAPVATSSASPSRPQPVKAAEPNASAALTAAAARELKTFTSEPKKPSTSVPAPAPATESDEKSGLGDVRLATPKISRAASEQSADSLPSIDTQTTGSVSDALASSVRGGGTPSVPLPVGGEVQSAQLIKSVPPVYPAMAKSQHVSGNVQVDALIDASGNVAELKIISGPSLLHRAALDAVKQWKYKPAVLDGQPTSMHLTVTVQFHAQ